MTSGWQRAGRQGSQESKPGPSLVHGRGGSGTQARGQFVEIHLKIQGRYKGKEEARGPEHYLMWRMAEEPRVSNLEKRSLRAKRDCSPILEGFHEDPGEDIFFVSLESKPGPRDRNDRSTRWFNSRKVSPPRGAFHLSYVTAGNSPGPGCLPRARLRVAAL